MWRRCHPLLVDAAEQVRLKLFGQVEQGTLLRSVKATRIAEAMTRAPLSELPFWPRYLSRQQAAVYLGVSPDTFDGEVQKGVWPAPKRRGSKGGRLTWDRHALDAAADRDSGTDRSRSACTVFDGRVGARSRGETKRKRTERRSKAAG